MKKIICIILAIVMGCGLIGCGGNNDEIASAPNATSAPTPLTAETSIQETVIITRFRFQVLKHSITGLASSDKKSFDA